MCCWPGCWPRAGAYVDRPAGRPLGFLRRSGTDPSGSQGERTVRSHDHRQATLGKHRNPDLRGRNRSARFQRHRVCVDRSQSRSHRARRRRPRSHRPHGRHDLIPIEGPSALDRHGGTAFALGSAAAGIVGGWLVWLACRGIQTAGAPPEGSGSRRRGAPGRASPRAAVSAAAHILLRAGAAPAGGVPVGAASGSRLAAAHATTPVQCITTEHPKRSSIRWSPSSARSPTHEASTAPRERTFASPP